MYLGSLDKNSSQGECGQPGDTPIGRHSADWNSSNEECNAQLLMNPQIDASQKLPKPWHTINLACMALICCTYTSCWFCRISLHDGSRILIPISETLEQFCEDHILHSKHQHVFWFTAHAHTSWNWLPLENHNTRCRWRSKPVFLEFWLFCVNFALKKNSECSCDCQAHVFFEYITAQLIIVLPADHEKT